MKEVVMALMLWINQNSHYDTMDISIPQVVEMSPEELTDEAYSDAPQMKPENGVDERVWARYNFEDGPYGTIYILGAEYTDGGAAPDEPAYMDPVFQERLLHELIHHVQHKPGAYDSFRCRNFGELDAYKLGGMFLKQRHARDPLPNRQFWSRVYSRG